MESSCETTGFAISNSRRDVIFQMQQDHFEWSIQSVSYYQFQIHFDFTHLVPLLHKKREEVVSSFQ